MTKKFVVEFKVSDDNPPLTAHDVQIKLAMMFRVFHYAPPKVLGVFTEEDDQ